MKTTFCPECRVDTTYTVMRQRLNNTINTQTIEYDGEIAFCDNCGKEVWISEIHDSNLDALYAEYRNINASITPEMILEIVSKYSIGKRPLSILLGWGEQTVSRYIDGHIPSKQYSDKLIKIYNEPEYYRLLLERNKDNLASQLTYNKSRQALESILEKREETISNIDIIVQYVLNKGEDITHLTIQKALYYIQGFYYAFYHDYLIKEDCEAWVHGPVFRSIYYRYLGYSYDTIEKPNVFADGIFNDMEKVLIDSVIRYICCYSGKVLEAFTHREAPWRSARNGLPAGASSTRIIPKDEIGSYFSGIKEKYKMNSPADIYMYSVEMFKSVNG